eukprot:TRINITY_DN5379_c0_g2_i1.p1 TRINITY_DN5379_c0_g2~~TRINITY_DN5379_c0_g2_i1.p1  ORF type:complete len:387 (+),score=53.03 TRINITY_DN5379_c0_g2_i1:112-1272(+)
MGGIRRPRLCALLGVLTFILEVLGGREAATASVPLRFNPDGSFKVVIFSDLHFGENPWDVWGPEQDRKSLGVMGTILDTEHPDFVIFLGDQLTANNLLAANASAYWRQLTGPCRSRKTPWAAVLGNHDHARFQWDDNSWFGPDGIPGPYDIPKDNRFGFGDSTPISPDEILAPKRRHVLMGETDRHLCLSQEGPSHLWPAVGNYYLPILSSNGREASAFFYFLDSGGGDIPEVLSHRQGQWLNETMHNANPSQKPEFVFFHIPLPAMASLGPSGGAPLPSSCVGNISKDDASPVTRDWGLLDIISSRASVQATFSGHNHGNDWCCPYESRLWLCYARHTGYGGYGDWIRGAKVLQFTESPFALSTWIRFEDGTKAVLGTLPNVRYL